MEKLSKKEKFINKSKKLFFDNFDYSDVDYKNSTTKIKLRCIKHNHFFEQIPSEHLRGKIGCNYCTRNPKVDTSYFIEKSISIHGDKYEYSLTNYIDAFTKVKIVCKKHGVFEVLPNNHYKQNCPKCSNSESFLTTNEFIKKASKIHNDKYNYSNVLYSSSKDKIKILCPEHGEFEQIPNDHLMGKGCPKCGITNNQMETEIKNFITLLNIKFDENIKKIIPPLELDIFIQSHNIAIEFNGLYWHSEIYKDKDYHLKKTLECEKKGIHLIHIFEDEWLFKKDIVKSRLMNILGLTPNKIFARKCVIKEVSSKDSKEFLQKNHIQGNVNNSIRLGLYHNDELVSLMTFGQLRKSMGSKVVESNYELYRFCNKINTSVIGGASKLLKYFIKLYQPKEIISYADRRWSQGDLYENLNFLKTHNTKPNYFYIINNNRHHRYNFRKDMLIKEGFDSNLTEHKIMLNRKIYRIYDCGSITYKLSI